MMKKATITAHCLIKNEERWIWYAILSVIDYVDKILVFDTGSTDNTVRIVKSIKSSKIIFEQKGEVNKKKFTKLRQEMLNKTDTDWFMILDGDEIWPKKTIFELKQIIINAPKHKQAIVVGHWACVGDVFHYSKSIAEEKQPNMPNNLTGFRSTRAIKNIKGLCCTEDYGKETFIDKNGEYISDWNIQRKIYIKCKFFHMCFLPRSSSRMKDKKVMMRRSKTLFYKGTPFPKSIKYPEVFFIDRPDFVPSPWRKFTWLDYIRGFFYRSENFAHRLFSKNFS